MNLEGFNLWNVCRLCLRSSNDLKNIFGEGCAGEQRNMDLSARIMACVSLEILPSDHGPHAICEKCLESINSWFEFNEVCQVSNAILSKYLNLPLDFSKRNTNQLPGKSNSVNEPALLPEISIHSHDSLLDRISCLESNVSPMRDFCISPTAYKLPNFATVGSLGATLAACGVGRANNFANVITASDASGAPTSPLSDIPARSESPVSVAVTLTGAAAATRTMQKKGYECELCGITFPRFTGLLSHDSKVHVGEEKRSSCSVCGRLFVSGQRLKTHQALVHRERAYRCDVCHKMFASKKSLCVHRRLHSEKYKCELCGFVTTAKLNLVRHRSKHEEGSVGETFECATCQKRFAYRSSLLRHENLHLTDRGKVFGCTVCHLSVRSASELAQHMNVHRRTEGEKTVVEKRHRCDVCRKAFESKRVLRMHVRRHRPSQLACDVCDKKMFSRYELHAHQETHSNFKRFACFHCDKRFSFKNTLVRHVKKHYERVRSDLEA